ncbi:MAG: hypothetical protein UHI81_04290, partial [Olegusella sp.]|nr:hypothetical protein [Olegusella sp.]
AIASAGPPRHCRNGTMPLRGVTEAPGYAGGVSLLMEICAVIRRKNLRRISALFYAFLEFSPSTKNGGAIGMTCGSMKSQPAAAPLSTIHNEFSTGF